MVKDEQIRLADSCFTSIAADQDNEYLIVIDAARPAERISQTKGPAYDRRNTNSDFICFADKASYFLEVKKADKYYRWARVYLPSPGTWGHFESMDNNPVQECCYGNWRGRNDPAGQWFWYLSPYRYRLDQGIHEYSALKLWNGQRIDRIVFTTNSRWTPPASLPAPTPLQTVQKGIIISSPIYMHGAMSPAGIVFDHEVKDGGSVDAYFRNNDGAWQDYSEFASGKTRNESTNQTLQFRIVLTRDSTSGKSPTINNLSLQYFENKTSIHALGSGDSTLTVSAAGHFIGASANGIQTVLPFRKQCLIDLLVEETNKTARWLGDALVCQNVEFNKEKATFDYSALENKIRVHLEIIPASDGVFKISGTITNDSDFNILEQRIVSIAGIRIGNTHRDDKLVWQTKRPEIINNPAEGEQRTYIYPRAAMCWLNVYDNSAGLFISAIDRDITVTRLECIPTGDGKSVGLSLTKLDCIPPHSGRSYECHLAAHPGDWHRAADIYRNIFYSLFPKPVYAEWMKESQGYFAPCFTAARTLPLDAPPLYTTWCERDILSTWRLGFAHAQIWGQAAMIHACPTYYLPDPLKGGEDNFIKYISEMKNAGIKVGSYFCLNQYVPSVSQLKKIQGVPLENIPEEVRPPNYTWFQRNRSYTSPDDKGPPPRPEKELEEAGNCQRQMYIKEYTTMCWAGEEWPKYNMFWMKRYVSKYQHNVIYHDTMGAYPDHPEYNPFYKKYGDGKSGLEIFRFLKLLQETASAINPDYAQFGEVPADAYSVYAGILASGGWANMEVFRYTLPEHLIYFGMGNGNILPPKSHEMIRRAFLEGAKFDVIIKPDAIIEATVWLRESFAPWLFQSVYRHNVGLSSKPNDLYQRVFTVNSEQAQGVILTFWNRSASQTNFEISVNESIYGSFRKGILLKEEALTPLVIKSNQFPISLGNDEVAAVVLIKKAEGKYRLFVHVKESKEVKDAFNVSLANAGNDSVQVECNTSIPFGQNRDAGRDSPRVNIDPLKVLDITCPVAKKNIALSTPVSFTIKWSDGRIAVRRALINWEALEQEEKKQYPKGYDSYLKALEIHQARKKQIE